MSRPVLAVTPGDLAGIGPEVFVRALSARVAAEGPPAADLLVYAPRERFLEAAAPALDDGGAALPLLRFRESAWPASRPLSFGDPSSGEIEILRRAICLAVHDALLGRVDALWTGPVHKNVFLDWPPYGPGHTETLRAMAGAGRAVMLMWARRFGTLPLTAHIPHAKVPEHLSIERIVEDVSLAAEVAERLLGRPPRVVVTGLNPHAGEGGRMGGEEIRILGPAVGRLRDRGLEVVGPVATDGVFAALATSPQFDLFACPTHDQALVPIKAVAFDHAVNVTVGLPFFRVSPDHGPAFDIAGLGTAHEGSARAALDLAFTVLA